MEDDEDCGVYSQSECSEADIDDDPETVDCTWSDYKRTSLSDYKIPFQINTDCNDNGQLDIAEEIIDVDQAQCIIDGYSWSDADSLCFVDRGNGVLDPEEKYIDFGAPPNGIYDVGEYFIDRNCNDVWDPAEIEDIGNGIFDSDETDFLDVNNNGVADPDELFTLSSVANNICVDYSEDNNGEILKNVFPGDSLKTRWGNEKIPILVESTFIDSVTKIVSAVERMKYIYSNQIIQEFEDAVSQNDYIVTKTNFNNDYDYILYKAPGMSGFDSNNIIKLTFPSYFLVPGFFQNTYNTDLNINFHTWFQSDHEGESEYINWYFSDQPIDEVLFYSFYGQLRDRETVVIDTTIFLPYGSEYKIHKSYYVEKDTVTTTMDEAILNSDNEDDWFVDSNGNGEWDPVTFYGDSCFRVERTIEMTLVGPDITYGEKNISWLVKGIGIVKDEVWLKWTGYPFNWEDANFNESQFNDCLHSGEYCGYQRLYLDEIRPVELSRNGIFSSKVLLNNIDHLDEFDGEPFKKTKTVGIQRVNITRHIND